MQQILHYTRLSSLYPTLFIISVLVLGFCVPPPTLALSTRGGDVQKALACGRLHRTCRILGGSGGLSKWLYKGDNWVYYMGYRS